MADPNMSQATVIGEIRHIKALVEETETSLRSQREILKMRGLNLPPMALQAVGALRKELEGLEQAIVDDQTELGQLRFLTETASMINSSLELDSVLSRSMDVVIDLTNAERGYIILRNPDTHEFEFRVMRESELTPRQGGSQPPQISQTILREVLETGKPLLADNAYKDDRLQSGMSIAQMSLRSVLCVPLRYRDDTIGVVYVDNRLRAGVFTDREKNLLTAFSNQAAVAIENAQLFQRIQQSLVEISEMKKLMDNVFASIGSGVITTDAKHNVTLFNKAAASILNAIAESAVGRKLGTVIPGVSADLDAHLAKVRSEEAGQELEAEMEVTGRGRIAVSMKFSPLKDAQQQTQGVAMVMDDLTEQRMGEETLNLMRRYLPPEMVDNIHTISRLALGGERREVTCMFVNVRPIASFPADFRPQQVMEQLNQYLTRVTNSIHHHKGMIDKYMGNVAMALFNTQLNPMDDHALRALEAALMIRDAFVEFYAELGIDPNPHYYRIGIHAGVATLGNVGSLNRREFSAIGDTINLSKRLEENATEGQIIVSEDFLGYVQQSTGSLPDTIRVAAREPLQVKGRKQKTPIYEVFKA
ncbi:MAG: GAF domain-containing protein [Chloroflexota bacterium]